MVLTETRVIGNLLLQSTFSLAVKMESQREFIKAI